MGGGEISISRCQLVDHFEWRSSSLNCSVAINVDFLASGKRLIEKFSFSVLAVELARG